MTLTGTTNVVVMCRYCTNVHIRIENWEPFECERCGETVDPNDPNGRVRVPPQGGKFRMLWDGEIEEGKPLWRIRP